MEGFLYAHPEAPSQGKAGLPVAIPYAVRYNNDHDATGLSCAGAFSKRGARCVRMGVTLSLWQVNGG